MRQYPAVIKALTGLPTEACWTLVAQLSVVWGPHDRNVSGALIAGARWAMAVQVTMVLTYLRLHVPQAVVGLLFRTSRGKFRASCARCCRWSRRPCPARSCGTRHPQGRRAPPRRSWPGTADGWAR